MKVVVEVIEFEKELQALREEIRVIREIINNNTIENIGINNNILQTNINILQKLDKIELDINKINEYNKEPIIGRIGKRIKEFVEDLRK